METVVAIPAPQGVAVDAEGRLWITSGHAIHRLTAEGEVERVAGGAVPGFGGDDGPAAESLWNQPGALWISGNGDVFVVDRGNHRVRRLRARPTKITRPVASRKR